jgi:hypothetical protein
MKLQPIINDSAQAKDSDIQNYKVGSEHPAYIRNIETLYSPEGGSLKKMTEILRCVNHL